MGHPAAWPHHPTATTHHHEVELAADAAHGLKHKGDPGHLLAVPVLQRRLRGTGDTGDSEDHCPPHGSATVPVGMCSPEARHHQCEDHEVVVGCSCCRVDVVPSHLPACKDEVTTRRGSLLPVGTGRGRRPPVPAIPLYSKLMPLSTVVSMLGGSTFHHLYSSPSTGSVPAGQRMQPGDTGDSPAGGQRPRPPRGVRVPGHPTGRPQGPPYLSRWSRSRRDRARRRCCCF